MDRGYISTVPITEDEALRQASGAVHIVPTDTSFRINLQNGSSIVVIPIFREDNTLGLEYQLESPV